ncbi:MAG: holo-ACP synthase [Hyphomonadaceae bacterium]|nr:holo-ACP synthase [Clostridia bacterium]
MVVGTGIDIVEIERVRDAIFKNERFIFRYFTEAERTYWQSRSSKAESLAGIFAAKEAVIKAIGSGYMQDIEINHDASGKPFVQLSGQTAIKIAAIKEAVMHITISHTRLYAVAHALLESRCD